MKQWMDFGHAERLTLRGTLCIVAVMLLSLEAIASPGVWEFGVPLLQGRDHAGSTVGGDGKIYIIGGAGGSVPPVWWLSTAERFDELTQQWESISSPYVEPVGSPAMATDLLGRVYTMGGVSIGANAGTFLGSIYRYAPDSDSWTSLAPMPIAQWGSAVTDTSGYIYLIGGRSELNTSNATNLVQRYDPESNTWSQMPNMTTTREGCAALCDSLGRIWAFGGFDYTNGHHSSVERFDPNHPELGWVYATNMSVATGIQGTVGNDGLFYLAGGWLPGHINSVNRYDPVRDEWLPFSSMNRATNNFGVVTSHSGRIYAVGGDGADNRVEYVDLVLIRVDKDTPAAEADQDGLTWQTAFDTIQEGVDAASAYGGGQVWVAEGTYGELRTSPGVDNTGMDSGSIVMKPNVHLFGGFVATESALNERDWRAHETVLDGSVSRNGNPAFHVIVGANDSTLDGFTITGGYTTENFQAGAGAGMFNRNASPLVQNCRFTGNIASNGAGMYNTSSNAIVDKCFFYGNNGGDGGAINNIYSSPTFTNCLIFNNIAVRGAGVYSVYSSSPLVLNCTIANNTASLTGGGLFSEAGATVTVRNTIVWGNTGGALTGSSYAVSYSDIQEGFPGSGNIDLAPAFVGESENDFRLMAGSPCIDVGTSANAPDHDLEGTPRPVGAGHDMGAYESPVYRYLVDKDNVSGIEDGLTWATAFNTIQEGVDAASAVGGASVWVAEGTYISATSPVVTLYANVKLYGGFEGVESSLGQRDWTAYITTIDGENSRRCVVGANNTVLDGFTVIRGATSGSWPANCGGGVLAEDCSMAIDNCKFYLNRTTGYHAGGAAIASFGAAVVVNDCLFENNTASDAPGGGGGAGIYSVSGSFVRAVDCVFTENHASGGVGIYVESADCEVQRCEFLSNKAWGYGGAILILAANLDVEDCTFIGNSSLLGGAFIDNNASSTSMTNCLFANNSATINGGAMRTGGTFTMTNCTLADNTAPAGGGWMFVNTGKTATAVNCIFWDNSPNGIGIEGGGSPTVTYSDVQAGSPGIGNINVDPEFLDTAVDDYHLQSTSPCIDTGTFVNAPDHDLEGTPRPIGAGWDMGVYEGGHESPNSPPIAVCCDVTVQADAGGCEANASIDCGSYDPDDDPVTIEQIPAGPYSLGTTSVTLRVTDEQGAVDECTANVTVVDETPPTLTCPPGVTVAANAYCEGEVPPAQVQPSDNCGLVTVEQVPPAGTKVGLGSHPVTVTATDESGNSGSCVFVFTVVDVTPPSLICPADQEVPADANCEGEIPVALAQVTDECGPVTLEQTPAAGTKVGLGIHPVAVTATDGSGNSSTCVFVVSVVDVTPPELTCPADVNLTADTGCDALVPDLASVAIAMDACDVSTATQSPAAGTAIGLGVTPVTISASDAAENTSSCVVNVTVLDTTPPEITCPGDQVVAALDCEYHVEFEENATAVDNCDPNPVITYMPPSGSVLGPGVHTVTCTATDASGNTSDCSFTVTVLEPLRIVFISPLEDDNVRDNIETDLDAVNKFKVGQTIPVKVKLFDCSGNDVTATVGASMTLRLDATERQQLGETSELVNDLPEDYSGLGDAESTMVLVGDHFQYNLDTDGFEQGTLNNSSRFFRVHVTSVQNTDPGVIVGDEDASLESK